MAKRTVTSVQVMADIHGSEIIVNHEFLRHYISIFNIHIKKSIKIMRDIIKFCKYLKSFVFWKNTGALGGHQNISLLKRRIYYTKYKGYKISAKFKEIFHNANRFVAKDVENINVIPQNILF